MIPKAILEHLRRNYPKGCRVELIHMDDPYNKVLHPGCLSPVKCVDEPETYGPAEQVLVLCRGEFL